MTPTAYPLLWPIGWKRTQNPEFSKFKAGSPYQESLDINRQLELMGATDIVISSNMQYRADGLPYARQGYISDTGVAVYFKVDGREQCIPCDKWVKLEDNLRAIAKTIEALRGIDRWGAKEMVDAAFRGFTAIPASTGEQHYSWWEILGVDKNATKEQIKAAFKELSRYRHPDSDTGSDEKFIALKRAYEEGMAA
jgi:hypothetical protein